MKNFIPLLAIPH